MFKHIARFSPNLDVQTKLSGVIIGCFAAGLLLYLSLLDRAGNFGAVVGSFLGVLLGRAAFVMPVAFLVSAIMLIRLQKNMQLGEDINPRLLWGVILMIWALTGFFSLIFQVTSPANMQFGGGLVGYVIYPLVLGNFGAIGGFLILFCMALFGFFLLSQQTFVQFLDKIQASFSNPAKFWDLIPDIFEIWKDDAKPQEAVVEVPVAQEPKPTKTKSDSIMAEKAPDPEKLYEKLSEQTPLEAFVTKPRPNIPLQWQLPPFDILKDNHTKQDPGDIGGNKKIIQETLQNFGISVEMDDVVIGPTVSQYTFKPASGVKLSSIDGLQRDLALALATTSLRIESPVSGKSLVGLQIPNKTKSQVRLRNLIQTKKFVNFEGDLPIAVGLDVAGNNIIYSLAKMPHLLVAGSTGSGKSVWINNLLLSLLYRYSPQELQLILVDMKRVELKLYEKIPHLLAPVITDAEKAINALKWTVVEMDRRYKLLEEYGKRNIIDYNNFASQNESDEILELPYIVFVIDELGDLMMLAKNEVEPIIVRLTQMSRAVGIHLVLGTQRPDTTVVTGLIKANVPTRIAFAVASQIDSRVILDQGGAEKLLGQGDGLFLSPSNLHSIRFQGPNVEEIEVRKCVDFLRNQIGENEFLSNFSSDVTEPPRTRLNVPGMSMKSDRLEEGDDVYSEARTFVIRTGKASTSLLQTALGIGYPKARKIIDRLEEENVIGPGNGSKPRDVYILPEEA